MTAVLAVSLLCRWPGPRLRRVALALMLLAGFLNVNLTVMKRIGHSNLGHYYIGAKYVLPYFDFYRLVAAGQGSPQMMFRDLRHPDRLFRTDARQQRLYYLNLLEAAGTPARADATTQDLADACWQGNLLLKEADAIVSGTFTPDRAEDFRSDLARVRIDLDDNGFNGSPLYVLVRQFDPTLRQRFSWRVYVVNLLWQLASLWLVLRLLGSTFGWDADTRLFLGAVFLASWDFAGWALNGLTFGGWLLPIALACWASRRRLDFLAGFAIAWAGLLKLFPYALLLVPFVPGVRAVWNRLRGRAAALDAAEQPVRRFLVTLAGCAAGTFALAALSGVTGASWGDFARKIVTQFVSSGFIVNGVGLSQILLNLGIRKSAFLVVPQAVVFSALLAAFWTGSRRPERTAGAILLLLACMGWLTQTWFNYYALAALFLLPSVIQANRRTGAAILALYAFSYALPDYDACYIRGLYYLGMVKVLPHLLLPLAALAVALRAPRETAGPEVGTRGRPLALAGVVVSVLALCFEVARFHAAGSAFQVGSILREQGRSRDALPHYARAVRLLPRDAQARFNLGFLLDELGDYEGAREQFVEALRLNPRFAEARSNLGILLIRAGRNADALAEFEAALDDAPYDDGIHVNIGAVLTRLDQPDAAAGHYRQALRINPRNERAGQLLAGLDGVRGPQEGAYPP